MFTFPFFIQLLLTSPTQATILFCVLTCDLIFLFIFMNLNHFFREYFVPERIFEASLKRWDEQRIFVTCRPFIMYHLAQRQKIRKPFVKLLTALRSDAAAFAGDGTERHREVAPISAVSQFFLFIRWYVLTLGNSGGDKTVQ